MELEDLRTFVEVAEAGGVSAAARRLRVAKSIISRRVLRLEEELRVQLLARTARGAALTQAGKTFRDYAARVCTETDSVREELLPDGELRGLLRLAAPASFGPVHLAPTLADLAHRHPMLHIHTSYSDRYVDLVREGFDCGIRVGYLPSSNLVARRIGEIPMRLYASPDYVRLRGAPSTPKDLLKHPAVMPGTETWKFSDGKKTYPINPQGRIKADNAVALAEAIAAGLGIGPLGDAVADAYVAAGRLVPVMSRYTLPPVGFFIVRPPSPHVPRKVKVLMDSFVERFGADARPAKSAASKPRGSRST